MDVYIELFKKWSTLKTDDLQAWLAEVGKISRRTKDAQNICGPTFEESVQNIINAILPVEVVNSVEGCIDRSKEYELCKKQGLTEYLKQIDIERSQNLNVLLENLSQK